MNNVESQMENGLLIVRQQTNNKDSAWRCVSICAFLLLVGATIIFALLHFQIIPRFENKDEYQLPEILAIKTYLESVPPEARAQVRHGQKLAAHFPGVQQRETLIWQETEIMDEPIILKDNAIVIPKDGLYFVYTQVSFTGSSCQSDPLQLTYTVFLKTKSYDEQQIILTSSKTVCEAHSSSSWFQPIYQGGIFQFEKNDVISTETKHGKFLDQRKGRIYLGIMEI
ncbi:hypothetical protein GDO86_015641 [Hymenochirus boettgeri]|uniref:THD domain-containing protein n=1 Tax=Hymenochirus boettgeri TaxID=247094 RepID=A0A8T2JTR9_9PIPI|nr:hypothetical protein GDO86_015641 [Hymenochirus boettgeri]